MDGPSQPALNRADDVDRSSTSDSYWSFSNEEDCNEYASAFVGWYSVTTILCVVFGWALIFITSLGAAITGFMAPTVKDIDSRIVHVNSNQAAQTVGPVVLVPTGAVNTSTLVTRQDSEGNLPEHAGAGGAALELLSQALKAAQAQIGALQERMDALEQQHTTVHER